MADNKTKIVVESADAEEVLQRLHAVEQRLGVTEAKLAALESGIEQPNYGGESVATGKQKATLSGQTFNVGGEDYQAKFPKFQHNGKVVTEAELLEDKALQNELVKGGFGVIRKVAGAIALLLMFAFGASASSVTITANGAEVVATPGQTFSDGNSRVIYPLQDLLIITRPSTDGFEIKIAETQSKVWGGDIDSVTIAGATTDGDKWAFLCTLMLQGCTTNGYICWMGRNNLEFNYKASNSRVEVKYGRNRQPLWFGHLDSLKANRVSMTLAYMRLLNRYKAEDCLPSTSVATIAAGAAAGSSPTVAVTGDAFSGSISVTTGTSATTGTLATVTLKITAPTGTRISLTPTNANACLHVARWYAAGTTTTLVITTPATALSDATAYTFNYQVETY